jgi:PAS domain S-box-containing protein
MKIKTKLFSIFLVTTLIILIVGIVSFWFYSNLLLKTSIDNSLDLSVYSKSGHLNGFFPQQKVKNAILSKDHHWYDLLSGDFTERDYSYEEFFNHSEEIIKNNLHREYFELFVLDKNGKIILSTNNKRVGIDESQNNYFWEAKEKMFVSDIFSFNNGFVYAISSPIFNKTSGEYLGGFVTFVDMQRVFNITGDIFGVGDTGYTFLLNKDGVMITPFKSDESVVLTKKLDKKNYEGCFLEQSKNKNILLKSYVNIAGEEVVGSSILVAEDNWCLVVEEKLEEIVVPLDKLLYFLFVVVFVSIILIFIVSERVGSITSNSVKNLRDRIDMIEKGDLNYDVKLSTNDEIGLLSESFARLIETIKKSKEELDLKVKEQTKKIKENNIFLEEQQRALLNVLEDMEKEKYKTQTEKDKLNTIVESIGDGVFVVDKNLNVMRFNKKASIISGFSQEDVIGKKYNEILIFKKEKGGDLEDDFVKTSLETGEIGSIAEESVLIKKDGSEVPVDDSAAPIKDKEGNITGVVVVFRDVSLTRKVDKMKSEFVSVASHQLRTPLTGIQWVTERLLKISDKLPEKERDYVNDIYFSTKRLGHLVDDLLSVSRIEGGKLMFKPENIEVVGFINDYLEELKPVYEKKELDVIFINHPEKLEIFMDKSSLRNVLQSIVSNAVEYTPQKGKVEIKLEQKENKFILEVDDNGIGIPAKDQETIFEKFTRGENAQAVKTDGTGLGLYITKQTLSMIGGDIHFESEENKGTKFFIEFPLKMDTKNIRKDMKDSM